MKKEKRNITFKNLNIRSSESDGKKIIEGIIPYDSKSVPMYGTTEIIDKTAFNKSISDKTEIRALWNHDDSYILGNTKSGTLELENTDDGLICRCELPNTSYANDLWEIVTRGDVTTMSFGFRPVKWIDSENGKLRTLKEVKLDEVSYGVTYAAYPETNSQTYMRGFMKNKIDIETVNEILEKDEIDEKELRTLNELVSSINEVIKRNSSDEAAGEEPPKNDTPNETDTLNEKREDTIKQEINSLIDTLFEIEKENQEK